MGDRSRNVKSKILLNNFKLNGNKKTIIDRLKRRGYVHVFVPKNMNNNELIEKFKEHGFSNIHMYDAGSFFNCSTGEQLSTKLIECK